MVSAGINYLDTYFEFPELTKLQGEPNSESLFKLIKRAALSGDLSTKS
jgi:hypothetical protein